MYTDPSCNEYKEPTVDSYMNIFIAFGPMLNAPGFHVFVGELELENLLGSIVCEQEVTVGEWMASCY